MNEIKHILKEPFLLLIENDVLITWCKPKELWIRFDEPCQTTKSQIYSLIRQLEKFGYIKKHYDESNSFYYSETDKLTDFRVNHCQKKATKILTEELRLLKQEKAEKDVEIQITRELSKQLPEINFCLKNHIKNSQDIILKLNKRKSIILNILKNMESCIY